VTDSIESDIYHDILVDVYEKMGKIISSLRSKLDDISSEEKIGNLIQSTKEIEKTKQHEEIIQLKRLLEQERDYNFKLRQRIIENNMTIESQRNYIENLVKQRDKNN